MLGMMFTHAARRARTSACATSSACSSVPTEVTTTIRSLGVLGDLGDFTDATHGLDSEQARESSGVGKKGGRAGVRLHPRSLSLSRAIETTWGRNGFDGDDGARGCMPRFSPSSPKRWETVAANNSNFALAA